MAIGLPPGDAEALEGPLPTFSNGWPRRSWTFSVEGAPQRLEVLRSKRAKQLERGCAEVRMDECVLRRELVGRDGGQPCIVHVFAPTHLSRPHREALERGEADGPRDDVAIRAKLGCVHEELHECGLRGIMRGVGVVQGAVTEDSKDWPEGGEDRFERGSVPGGKRPHGELKLLPLPSVQ
jgi:hypothetical protein